MTSGYETSSRNTERRNREYAEAVKKGDMAKAREMVSGLLNGNFVGNEKIAKLAATIQNYFKNGEEETETNNRFGGRDRRIEKMETGPRDGLLHKLRGETDSEKEQGEGETVAEGGGPRFSMGKKITNSSLMGGGTIIGSTANAVPRSSRISPTNEQLVKGDKGTTKNGTTKEKSE